MDIVLSEGPSVTEFASFSPKRVGDMVAPKNKHEGQIPNKSNLHNRYKTSLFRWNFTVERGFEGQENGLSSVFSSLSEIYQMALP